MANKVPILSIEELEASHTGTLMARRTALLKCEESLGHSDQTVCNTESGFIEFKNTDSWRQAYSDLKIVLSKIENIPTKKERKALRQSKARISK